MAGFQAQERIELSEAEMERLAETLERPFSPTPALRKVLTQLADSKRRPPQLSWKDTSA